MPNRSLLLDLLRPFVLATAMSFAISAVGTSRISLAAEAESKDAVKAVGFHKDILPILRANCFGCHQGSLKQGGYLMTDFVSMLKGGESGSAAVVPGKPDDSHLIEEITPIDGKAEMPRKAPPLKDDEIKLIRRWIEQGAKDDSPAVGPVYSAEHPPQYIQPPIISSFDFPPTGSRLPSPDFTKS